MRISLLAVKKFDEAAPKFFLFDWFLRSNLRKHKKLILINEEFSFAPDWLVFNVFRGYAPSYTLRCTQWGLEAYKKRLIFIILKKFFATWLSRNITYLALTSSLSASSRRGMICASIYALMGNWLNYLYETAIIKNDLQKLTS